MMLIKNIFSSIYEVHKGASINAEMDHANEFLGKIHTHILVGQQEGEKATM